MGPRSTPFLLPSPTPTCTNARAGVHANARTAQFTLRNGLRVFLLVDDEVPLVRASMLMRGGQYASPPDKVRGQQHGIIHGDRLVWPLETLGLPPGCHVRYKRVQSAELVVVRDGGPAAECKRGSHWYECRRHGDLCEYGFCCVRLGVGVWDMPVQHLDSMTSLYRVDLPGNPCSICFQPKRQSK